MGNVEIDQRKDDGNRDRLDSIHESYLRFSRRAALALTIQGIVLIGSLTVLGYLVKENHDKTIQIRAIALRAVARSEEVRVRQILGAEKVCSQSSNQKVACRALFNRLANNISNKQQRRLTCTVLNQMRGPTARELRRETKC